MAILSDKFNNLIEGCALLNSIKDQWDKLLNMDDKGTDLSPELFQIPELFRSNIGAMKYPGGAL